MEVLAKGLAKRIKANVSVEFSAKMLFINKNIVSFSKFTEVFCYNKPYTLKVTENGM